MASRFIVIITILIGSFSWAQNAGKEKDSLRNTDVKSIETIVADIEKSNRKNTFSPIRPTKAGIYSALLPGLGQYHNKKYWKIPLVWGLIGTGVGITLYQNNLYQRYRNAFLLELDGKPNEFSSLGIPNLKDALGRQQDAFKRYRDYWIAITALAYLLNILDAVVDAHLYEGRRDPDLALKPTVLYNEYTSHSPSLGLQLSLRF